MDKEEKIKVMELFILHHTTRQIAEFIVNLEDAVEGLTQNNKSFQEEFRKIYKP
jgi:hypothetical protein